ncbi:STAS domain-containing protein [Actinoplanes sp. NPDC020271]|uniref:STAS domain-containing protein n=1 Tax=Actinoplanes sp. NPDC020271 TaxID=3363896 RepID=UPI00378F02F2
MDSDAYLIRLSGELDYAVAQELTEVLAASTGRSGVTAIHLDMAAVTFLDATIITVLVHAHQAAARTGRQLRVHGPQGRARRVLDLTGVLLFLSPDTATPDTGPR